jgi:hypothetical protein
LSLNLPNAPHGKQNGGRTMRVRTLALVAAVALAGGTVASASAEQFVTLGNVDAVALSSQEMDETVGAKGVPPIGKNIVVVTGNGNIVDVPDVMPANAVLNSPALCAFGIEKC